MTKPHGTDATGAPVDLIGQPLKPGIGSVEGIRVVSTQEIPDMAKAPSDGVYTLDGHRYIARKGAVLPEGAEFEAGADTTGEAIDEAPDADVSGIDEAPEARAKGNAPENRAKAEKAEKR